MTGKPVLTPFQQSAFDDALRTGIQKQDMDMITLALRNGAGPDILMFEGIGHEAKWREKLFGAYIDFGLKILKLAVEYGADVNATKVSSDDKPWAALHWAQSNFNPQISDFLIEKGAPVDVPSPFGNTVLMNAVLNGRKEQVEYYLGKGADPLHPCGTKPGANEEFPLRALETSDKFKPGVKNALLKLMMQKSQPAPAPSAQEETSSETKDNKPSAGEVFAKAAPANSDVALAQDIDVSRPVTLKHAAPPPEAEPQKPSKSFSL